MERAEEGRKGIRDVLKTLKNPIILLQQSTLIMPSAILTFSGILQYNPNIKSEPSSVIIIWNKDMNPPPSHLLPPSWVPLPPLPPCPSVFRVCFHWRQAGFVAQVKRPWRLSGESDAFGYSFAAVETATDCRGALEGTKK